MTTTITIECLLMKFVETKTANYILVHSNKLNDDLTCAFYNIIIRTGILKLRDIAMHGGMYAVQC